MLALLLRRDLVVRLLVCSLFVAATSVLAQEQQPPAPLPPTNESSTSKGLFNEIGKLLKSPADLLPSLTKSPTDSKPEAVIEPAPPSPSPPAITATPAASPPPAAPAQGVEPPAAAPSQFFPGFVGGREVCPLSPNGAPDCQAGANKLCQSKGYKSGKSLNTDAAYSCSAKRAPGRKPCASESFVTRAFCQ